jgi:hypothetical protein
MELSASFMTIAELATPRAGEHLDGDAIFAAAFDVIL